LRSNGPKGGRQGWRATKDRLERFLTLRSNGPKGGRQGWQATKNRPGGRLLLDRPALQLSAGGP